MQCNNTQQCLPIAAAIVVASPNMSSGDDDARMTMSMSAALTPAFCYTNKQTIMHTYVQAVSSVSYTTLSTITIVL
jgi:hypothetical protein